MQQNILKYCPNCGYKLSSEDESTSYNAPGEAVASTLDDYVGISESGIEVAVPEVLDNKKRLMKLRNRPTPIVRPKRMDSEMDRFGNLIVGEGLVQEG